MLDMLLEDTRHRGMDLPVGLSQAQLAETLRSLLTAKDMEKYLIARYDALLSAMRDARAKDTAVTAVLKVLRADYADHDISIAKICKVVHRSHSYLCVLFKRETGMTINDYLTEIRVNKAQEILRDRQIKLLDVARRVGYLDNNYFTKVFKRAMRMTPSEYRKNHLV